MERINKQHLSGILTDSRERSTSRTESIKGPSTEYVRACLLLVQKTRMLANSPTATEQEALIQATVWAEILCESIPINRLDDAYRRAAREHESTFPLGHGELIAAWRKIQAEHTEIREPGPANAEDCDLCFGAGMRYIEHSGDPSRSGFGPCDHDRAGEDGQPADGYLN